MKAKHEIELELMRLKELRKENLNHNFNDGDMIILEQINTLRWVLE